MKKIILVLSSLLFCSALQAKPIAQSADRVMPLLNGQFVPDVQVVDIGGASRSLKEITMDKKTILFFYRGGWCPFCNTQMGQLQKVEASLKKLGFQLIGISTDAPNTLSESVQKHELGYQLFSDFNSTASQAFGLAFFTSKKITNRYLAKMKLTNPLQKNVEGEARLVLPVPAIYVIDTQGLVQFSYVNPNYKVRLHEEVLLKAAELVR
ncbi:peroxiredoxin-like family protein [Colwelliaceae bacterium 6471]